MKFLDNYQEQSYALMRIVIGFMFIWHGTVKLFNFPQAFPYPLSPLMYAAGSIEVVGGALVMIGLLTRPAAFICSGMSAAAYWMAHGTKAFLPLLNGGELVAIFCFVFLFIASRGTGIWGISSD